jgi:protein required for attachment to host cells
MLATTDWKIVLNAGGETTLLFRRSGDETENLAGAEEFAEIQRDLEHRLLRRLVSSSSRDAVGPAPRTLSTTVATMVRGVVGDGRYDDIRMRAAGPLDRARHLVRR